jgi:uncharacterized protein
LRLQPTILGFFPKKKSSKGLYGSREELKIRSRENPDRFPKLRIAFLESGGGWMAGWLDRMHRHFDDVGMNDTKLTTRPSDIFRRQCFISFELVEGSLKYLAEYIGSDNILLATDYKHADGFPDAPT